MPLSFEKDNLRLVALLGSKFILTHVKDDLVFQGTLEKVDFDKQEVTILVSSVAGISTEERVFSQNELKNLFIVNLEQVTNKEDISVLFSQDDQIVESRLKRLLSTSLKGVWEPAPENPAIHNLKWAIDESTFPKLSPPPDYRKLTGTYTWEDVKAVGHTFDLKDEDPKDD